MFLWCNMEWLIIYGNLEFNCYFLILRNNIFFFFKLFICLYEKEEVWNSIFSKRKFRWFLKSVNLCMYLIFLDVIGFGVGLF